MAERLSENELSEKDFIDNTPPENMSPIWAIVLAFAALVAIFWGSGSWYYQTVELQFEKNPFLQVTNREMSVFLWQFPSYLPQHVKEKTGYLPGFDYQKRIGIKPEKADEYCHAPPELLFLYHTWNRLLKPEFIPRPIERAEFLSFLEHQSEWSPQNWQAAPIGYRQLVSGLKSSSLDDLSGEPTATLPRIVRQAFQGWKNYTVEGDQINKLSITYATLASFLNGHPHYARNYWRNILKEKHPSYLLNYTYAEFAKSSTLSKDELAPFLKVALYNFIQSQKGK